MTGTMYWIDHYTVPTNDLERAIAFHERVLGVATMPDSGLPRERGVFQAFAHPELLLHGGHCHQGLFVMREPLPASQPLGAGFPRHAVFVRPEDLDEHRRRLDALGVVHADPLRTSADGDDGTAIYWLDADGNQFEFWAPQRMPDGAMHDTGPFKIGRISHLTYASRDLERTAAFFERFCGLQPLRSADIGADTLVLPLAAGGRLVFKRATEPGLRASGRGVFSDCHTALVLRKEAFWPAYERMWAELPEWPFDKATRRFEGDGVTWPARTLIHGSPNGMKFHAAFGRGDDWIDPDCNLFHFVGGLPHGASMSSYDRFFLDDVMDAYLGERGVTA
ncbi:MAG TPA: VOC family protein [Candidatus Lustribacter sp.]|nr:VOC family protein [Candidatus Lustribacter sp.]